MNPKMLNPQFLESVQLSDKMFGMAFMMLIFALLTSFISVIIYLSVKRCQNDRENVKENVRQRKPTPEFVHWVQNRLTGRPIRKRSGGGSIFQCSRLDANVTIKNEADFQKIQEITLQEDNIFDDLEFYEIRSDISTDFCEDLKNKISWEEMIKSKILQAPSNTKRDQILNGYNSMPVRRKRKFHSNVRRNLMEEFNNASDFYIPDRTMSVSGIFQV